MQQAQAQQRRGTTRRVAVFVFVCATLAATLAVAFAAARAHAQTLDGSNLLWADDIFYEGTQQRFRTQGRVRLRINDGDARILILTDRLGYDANEGIVRAQGGRFGKGVHHKTQGALRLESGDVIFFQRLETDASLTPLRGEGLGWREKQKTGGITAASFRRRKRNDDKKDDWIFHNLRYTRCPICADALATSKKKQGQKDEKTTENKPRTLPPLWRIDATRMRWEHFEQGQGWFAKTPRIHLRHPRLVLYGVPVLYTPYLSFPRENARASGMLPPVYGQQSQRGWNVALPLYWSPHRGWDVTYTPVFTANDKDASRFETRIAWGAGSTNEKATENARDEKKEEGIKNKDKDKNKNKRHLFNATAGWSLPHDRIGSGTDAQFFAYAKARWRAPWGLRADGIYHGLGDRRYLYNYGQGVELLSSTAPSQLTDRARIEHFSRNGYARLTLEEQHELLAEPRADAALLPEVFYNNGGVFARSPKGGGSWQVEGLWRRVRQDEQQGIDSTIQQEDAFRQDMASAAVTLEWRQNLPWSFVSRSALKLATTYWHDTNEGDIVLAVPEFQQSLEGLFAQRFKNGRRVLYLRPLLEIYATLDDAPQDEPLDNLHDNLHDKLHDKLGGRASFYETGARLGDRLAFDSTIEGGQRLLVATEIGIRDVRDSVAALFVAPTFLRERDDALSGRLWTGVRTSWRDRLLLSYDSTWALPRMRLIGQRAEAGAKGESFALTLAYKEFRSFDSASSYEQDITVKGDLRLQKRWRLDLKAGYGFLGQSVPIGFSLTYKGSCVTLKVSYDRTIYSDREDSESFGASVSFDFS